MNKLERTLFRMKDLESRFDELGKSRKRYKNMPKEEYTTYRQFISAYANDLKDTEIIENNELYSEISDKMEHLENILRVVPENGAIHRKKMKSYIRILKETNYLLEAYNGK
jgi:hypothetical protein